MKFLFNKLKKSAFAGAWCFLMMNAVTAQTDVDAIMMSRNNFCTGFQYSYSTWDHYWEGKLKRTNKNLGNVSTQMIGWMGNYGITNKLNFLFSVPYVWTKASAGTLHSVDGIQDLSLMLKYKLLEKKSGKGKFSLLALGGFSFPVSNYVADYQPLAIGMRSKNLTGRITADYEYNRMFVTGTAAYIYRSNIEIDRNYYYTDEPHYTNEVKMPDAASFQFRLGYRGSLFGAEAILSNWTTLGGFDITRNNMPFPSNEMNATMAGISVKCNPRALPGLGLMLGGSYTLAGRNMGQAIGASGTVTYVFDFNKKTKKAN
jgi:hypothetical protein